MSEQTKEERARFQAWVQDRGCDTDGAWSAWQAAKSEVASALSLARSALQEREQRIRVLEEALGELIEAERALKVERLDLWADNRTKRMNAALNRASKAETAARSVLNKENGNG